jgi:hypothetical protein
MNAIRRTIHPEVRVLDAKLHQCEFVASDETVDSYREVIRANGWRFDHFEKNAPLVDSHDTSTIERQVGKVIDFRVVGNKLIETAQFAADVESNRLAKIGWDMLAAGYLRAVSVGFFPVKSVSRWDANPTAYAQMIKDLGFKPEDQNAPRCIYTEQQQIELSVCIIGANPNALARAYKASVLDDAAIDFLSQESTSHQTARAAADAADVARARQRQCAEFLQRFENALKAN